MPPIKVDGDFTVATPIGPYVMSAPIPGNHIFYIMRQTFVQFLDNVLPIESGTVHPIFGGIWYLSEETERQPIGGGVVKWDRIYAARPTTHYTWEQIPYNFIGFYGASGAINIVGRNREVKPVIARVQHDYFRISRYTGIDNITVFGAPDDIPIIPAQKYYWGTNPSDPYQWTDFLANNPPFTADTTPSRSTYEGWIAAGTEFVAEDSILEPWIYPMFVRKTKYIKAQ